MTSHLFNRPENPTNVDGRDACNNERKTDMKTYATSAICGAIAAGCAVSGLWGGVTSLLLPVGVMVFSVMAIFALPRSRP